MTIPRPGQTVHLISYRDVLRVWWDMHRTEGRNVRELVLYTTDDLRRLYQATHDDPIRLRDGIVSRVQLVAVIRWRRPTIRRQDTPKVRNRNIPMRRQQPIHPQAAKPLARGALNFEVHPTSAGHVR